MTLRAWLECAAIAGLYVVPLHRGKPAPRDAPRIIYRRACATLTVCCLVWLPLWHALKHRTGDAATAWQLLPATLGLRLQGLPTSVLVAFTLTATIFAGPLALLACNWWDEQQHRKQQPSGALQGERQKQERAIALRNYVISPLTEEFAFRACMAPLLILGGASQRTTVLAAPLFFGAAHLHHLYELLVFQHRMLAQALQQVLGQLMYTTIFGWYATWLFLRTSSIAAPIAAHAFCNAMGFPDFDAMSRHRHQPLLSAATAAGVLVFSILLRPLTDPVLFGSSAGVAGL